MSSLNAKTRRLSAVTVVVAAALVASTACSTPAKESAPRVEVEAGRDASLTSKDKQVRVKVPGGAISGSGTLSVIKAPGDRDGYRIRMGGGADLDGDASIAFKVPKSSAGAPPPLVSFVPERGGELTPAAPATLGGGYATVTTEHFSNWFTTWWGDVLNSLRGLMDRIYSADAQGKAPKCAGQAQAKADGYRVTSSKGAAVMWCLGVEKGQMVLKVVNARGYGVALEHTPGTVRVGGSNNDVVTALASFVKPAPSKKGNTVQLLAAGDSVTFSVPESGQAGVKVLPDPGAYLVSGLSFAVDTVLLVLDRSGMSRSRKQVLKAFDIGSCVAGFYDGATGNITNVVEAGRYLEKALTTMLGCGELAMKNLDLGLFAGPVAAGLVWLVGGVRTAANGLGAAADTILNVAGYRITVSAPGKVEPTFSDNPDEWPTGPGFLGPLKAGAHIDDLTEAGWGARSINAGYCDEKWQLSDSLYPRGIFGDFRDGDPDTLDGVSIRDRDMNDRPVKGRHLTAEGVGLGTSTADLLAAYPDLVPGSWQVEGGWFTGYVRSTAQGSIMFNVGSNDSDKYPVSGDGSKVTHIVVTGDTSTKDFAPLVGGC